MALFWNLWVWRRNAKEPLILLYFQSSQFPLEVYKMTLTLGCVPLRWSGSGLVIQDHSDDCRSIELMNPCPEWIHQFIWYTVIRDHSNHWSWIESSQRNALLVSWFLIWYFCYFKNMNNLITYMPFCIIAMAHSLWTLCEHGNIWQPLNASCK